MARGAAAQENLLNQNAGQQLGAAQQLYSGVSSADASIVNNGGFMPGQREALTSASTSPIAASFDTEKAQLLGRAARTRNDAGVTAGADQLAASKGQQLSNAAAGVIKTGIGNTNAAIGRQASLYGPTLGSANSLYGNATEAMKARNSVGQDIASGISDYNALVTP
jgi:hypothetical protein